MIVPALSSLSQGHCGPTRGLEGILGEWEVQEKRKLIKPNCTSSLYLTRSRLADHRQHRRLLEKTHTSDSPWWIVAANDKKTARLNCIHHLLQQIPYQEIESEPISLPARVYNQDYLRGPVPKEMYVPEIY